VEVPSQEVDPFLPACNNRRKVLIEDDGQDGCGKGRVGEIIHCPAKNLVFLNSHIGRKMFLGKVKEAGLHACRGQGLGLKG
jgi:hypothetical protein